MNEEKYYYIGDLAKHFGVSSDTLRLYDKKGILSPHKDEENNYRVYSSEDIICIDYIMNLRKIDMSLADVNIMINDCTLEQAYKIMRNQVEKLDSRIEELVNMEQIAVDYMKCFENAINSMDKIIVEQSPTFICKDITMEESTVEAMEAFSELTKTHIPKFSFICSPDVFLNSETYVDMNKSWKRREVYSNALTLVDEEEHHLKSEIRDKGFYVIESCKCLHVILKTSLNNDYSELEECMKHVKKCGYKVKGNVIYRLLMSTRNKEYCCLDINECWIPIE